MTCWPYGLCWGVASSRGGNVSNGKMHDGSGRDAGFGLDGKFCGTYGRHDLLHHEPLHLGEQPTACDLKVKTIPWTELHVHAHESYKRNSMPLRNCDTRAWRDMETRMPRRIRGIPLVIPTPSGHLLHQTPIGTCSRLVRALIGQ